MRLPRPGAVLTGAAPVPIAMLVVLVVAVVVAPLIALLIALAAAPTAGSTAPAAAAPSVDGHYRGFGDAGGFLNILPPGQKGTLTAAELAQVNAATTSSAGANDPSAYPAHVADQRQMYDDLNFAADNHRLDADEVLQGCVVRREARRCRARVPPDDATSP